jgi:hypothetical protein
VAYRDAVVRESETITIRDWQTWMWIVFLPAGIAFTLLLAVARSWSMFGIVAIGLTFFVITSVIARRAPWMREWRILKDVDNDCVTIIAQPLFRRRTTRRLTISEIAGVDVRETLNEYGRVVVATGGEPIEIAAAHLVMCREIAAVLENVRANARRGRV